MIPRAGRRPDPAFDSLVSSATNPTADAPEITSAPISVYPKLIAPALETTRCSHAGNVQNNVGAANTTPAIEIAVAKTTISPETRAARNAVLSQVPSSFELVMNSFRSTVRSVGGERNSAIRTGINAHTTRN